MNEFNEVTGYKANVENSVAFLHTNNEAADSQSLKNPTSTASKTIMYVQVNLNKEAKKKKNKTCTLKTIKHG